jgi:hypothetical protein
MYADVARPAPSTLGKYGLTLALWEQLLEEQDGLCGVCAKPFPKLVVDHVHVRGYKLMRPEARRKYVRGLCCTTCNHFVLTRYADARKHELAASYLRRYDARRAREEA